MQETTANAWRAEGKREGNARARAAYGQGENCPYTGTGKKEAALVECMFGVLSGR